MGDSLSYLDKLLPFKLLFNLIFIFLSENSGLIFFSTLIVLNCFLFFFFFFGQVTILSVGQRKTK